MKPSGHIIRFLLCSKKALASSCVLDNGEKITGTRSYENEPNDSMLRKMCHYDGLEYWWSDITALRRKLEACG